MLKISFTNAEVSDHGYGLEVNGKSLEDIISTALGTKLKGKPNVDEIKSLAIKHGADMIVIDQLSLMSDKRRADIPRIAYNNISEDLFLMSKELKKPVLLMAQANREAVKNRKKGESPELHDLAESDGVGQNATIPNRGIQPIINQLRGYEKVIKKDGKVVAKKWIPSILISDPEATKYCLKLDVKVLSQYCTRCTKSKV